MGAQSGDGGERRQRQRDCGRWQASEAWGLGTGPTGSGPRARQGTGLTGSGQRAGQGTGPTGSGPRARRDGCRWVPFTCHTGAGAEAAAQAHEGRPGRGLGPDAATRSVDTAPGDCADVTFMSLLSLAAFLML